jgi:hypothetical protein
LEIGKLKGKSISYEKLFPGWCWVNFNFKCKVQNGKCGAKWIILYLAGWGRANFQKDMAGFRRF